MGLNYKKILGVNISTLSAAEVLEEVKKYLKESVYRGRNYSKNNEKTLKIFTPNPEIIMHAYRNPVYKEVVNSAQINIPDGRGVAWGLKRIYGVSLSPVPGVEMMENMSRMAADCGFTIGLIGGKSRLAVNVAERLSKSYRNLKIINLGSPTIRIENNKIAVFASESYQAENMQNRKISAGKFLSEIAAKIEKQKIDILFVALGFPKQEYLINELSIVRRERSGMRQKCIMVGVGGAFDYITGKVKRAPPYIRNRGFEWFYRLIHEPWRLYRQIAGSEYFIRILLKP